VTVGHAASFVTKMVWRDVRATWPRLAFFFVCVGLGVASIVVLRSVVQEVRRTLTSEARSLVAADIVLSSTRQFTPELESRLAAVAKANGTTATSRLIDTQTMASAENETAESTVKLVELRGVEATFPFYGTLELEGGTPYAHALLENHGAVVQPELLAALDIKPGDGFRMAGEVFRVTGVIARDRSSRNGLGFGPRVYVDLAALERTTLIGFGSRATFQRLLKLDDERRVEPATEAIRAATGDDFVSVRSWKTLEDRIGQSLTTAENYLSLVGFAIVVLGGLGVWSVTRVIVQQRIRSVAVLKCLGAPGWSVLMISLLQIVGLAGVGSLLGLGIAWVAVASIPASMLTPLGVETVGITASAAVQGVAVGVLVSMLFALVPLLEIRNVKPLLLLRAHSSGTSRRRDWQSWTAGAATAVCLALVAVWQANSVRAGLYVFLGLAIAAGVLYLASVVLIRATRPIVSSSRFSFRHAAISLGRPGNQTRVILMTVGLGCFFIVGVRATQLSLIADLTTGVSDRSPDFVLIDVQQDQTAGVTKVLEPFLRSPFQVSPLMRARVVAVDGAKLKLTNVEAVREHRRFTREFGLTFRNRLEANEEIASGTFWNEPVPVGQKLSASPPGSGAAAVAADTEVSIEIDAADDGMVLGDLVTFDVAGSRITARVTSVRRVKWEDSQSGGFVFVLRPGQAVERLAHSYIGFAQIQKGGPGDRGGLQRALVRAYPNVSVIDVRDIIQTIRNIVDNVTLGVTVVGAVTLAGGILILVGAVAMTKFQRVYEAAIYRTLGASARLVGAVLAVEYGLLGALAGALGTTGAVVLSWALATYLFNIEWEPAPGLFAAGILVTTAVVAIVGVVSSLDVLRKKPLATLRSE
jgi:putative ABC transport system permease protein